MSPAPPPADPDAPLPGLPGIGRAGWRHLAQARRAARAVWLPRDKAQVPAGMAILGAGPEALSLAPCLIARGVAVTVIEEDADTAARFAAHLARRALPVDVCADDKNVTAAAVVLATGEPATAASRLQRVRALLHPGALLLQLGETRAADPGVPTLRLVVTGAGLVELLDAAPQAAGALLAALGCTPLAVPPGGEGAGARLLARHLATAEALIFAGVAPWELDEAAEALGFAEGPCALMDRLGLDRGLPRRARLTAAGLALPDPGVVARMVAEGRLGRRASVGWYRYPGGGGRVIDPLVEDLVREEAWFAGLKPRPLAPARAARHLLAALIDEAARLLADGAVGRAADIDLAAVLAAGFPPGLGGPVFLARNLGAAAVLDWLRATEFDLDGIAGVPVADPTRLAALGVRAGA